MKAGKAHRVPLSPRALEIVRSARALDAEGEFVFGGGEKPLSDMAFLMLLRRLGVSATAHGSAQAFGIGRQNRLISPGKLRRWRLPMSSKATSRRPTSEETSSKSAER